MPFDQTLAQNQSAFRCGFLCRDGSLLPFDGTPETEQNRGWQSASVAQAAAGLWPEAELVILNTAGRQVVCFPGVGIVVEGRGDLNLGLLRVMARQSADQGALDLDLGQTAAEVDLAVCNLGQWIARIEADRLLELIAGAKTFVLSARKGQFGDISGATPQTITAALRTAAADTQPVKFRYLGLDVSRPDTMHPAHALCGALVDEKAWVFDADGHLQSLPVTGTWPEIAGMIRLHALFAEWRGHADATLKVMGTGGTVLMQATAQDGETHLSCA